MIPENAHVPEQNTSVGWPSLRLQRWITIILVIGAVLTALVPPISRERRAQKLYEDAWFYGFYREDNHFGERRTGLLNKALALSPGNSLYEQGLIWHCPMNDLQRLLREHKFGPKATRLAYGALYAHSRGISPTGWRKSRLDGALELQRLDPGNSIAQYFAAGYLADAHSWDKTYACIQKGNSLGAGWFYVPEVSPSIRDSIEGVFAASGDDRFISEALRSAARRLRILGNERLRNGDVQGACNALEMSCRMGVNYALSKPLTTEHFLEGHHIFARSWKTLGPIYKNFGMHKELAEYSRILDAFRRGSVTVGRQWRLVDMLGYMLWMFCAPMLLMVLYLFAAVPALADFPKQIWQRYMKRRRETPLEITPWDEGWLVRLFLAVYSVPVWLAVVLPALAHVGHGLRIREPDVDVLVLTGIAAGLMLLIQIGLLVVMFRKMRKAYIGSTGGEIGLFQFVFKGPANRQVWMLQHVQNAGKQQYAFLVCLCLLIVIIFKPLYGFQVWQLQRHPFEYPRLEAAIAKQVSADVVKVCPPSWHLH